MPERSKTAESSTPEKDANQQLLKPNTLYSIDFFGNAREEPELQAAYQRVIAEGRANIEAVLQKMRRTKNIQSSNS